MPVAGSWWKSKNRLVFQKFQHQKLATRHQDIELLFRVIDLPGLYLVCGQQKATVDLQRPVHHAQTTSTRKPERGARAQPKTQLLEAGRIALPPAVYLPRYLALTACQQGGQAAERDHRDAALKAEPCTSQLKGVDFRWH